ncbi:GAF domain-containing protein [Sphingomonas solaris]|uniref:GAF domain-containing protein n=1 Tax=Alterirhizorhabdus solaris TaxID=2529389 RepID=A0A558QVH7_9SPHN|nr:GAF domain-containing protein [Sphingomonas solaris]TVV71153.1 GAF domain-containing protein [Sphingomonas solaris]
MKERLTFFSPPPLPADEDARQAAVDALPLARAAGDPRLAAIVAEAAALFGLDAAVISIIDGDRQRWVVRHGVGEEGTPRAISFCGHALLTPDKVFTVPDARADRRFAGNPLVTGAPRLRFYAGAPLVQDGAALGALCVIDQAPHKVSDAQRAELARLAAEAVAILSEPSPAG